MIPMSLKEGKNLSSDRNMMVKKSRLMKEKLKNKRINSRGGNGADIDWIYIAPYLDP